MTKMKRAYDNPYYYEISLSRLRNFEKDVDFFEQIIHQYSKIDVKTMLEIGCGNSPYLVEICKRGYKFVGLDLNKRMLSYSQQKARQHAFKIKTVCANMLDFELKKKADFAFVLFDSVYRKRNTDFLQHLACLSKSIKSGGIYLLHMVVDGSIDDLQGRWIDTAKQGKISTKTIFERKIIDFSKQLRKETFTTKINNAGKVMTLFESDVEKFILPEEFKLLIEKSDFEFVEWFDGFDFSKKFDKTKNAEYLVCIVRKK